MILLKKVAAVAVISLGFVACDSGTNSNENNDNAMEGQEEMKQPQQNNQQMQQQMPAGTQQPQQRETVDLSDEELKQFMVVAQEMQKINQAAQQEMMTAIEGEGMKVDRYTQIQQMQQDPNQEADATAEEMQTFESATQKLEEIQMSSQEEMGKKLEDAGLSQAWYQETAMAIQSNQELMMRFQQLQQGGAGGQAQPQPNQ